MKGPLEELLKWVKSRVTGYLESRSELDQKRFVPLKNLELVSEFLENPTLTFFSPTLTFSGFWASEVCQLRPVSQSEKFLESSLGHEIAIRSGFSPCCN